jgi:hypothetical protein
VTKEKFEAGIHFPLWATCLGLEVAFDIIHGSNTLDVLDGWDLNTHVRFTKKAETSRMLADIDLDHFEESVSVYHNHLFGITPMFFKKSKPLREFFDILALTPARDGVPIIAITEAKNYPIYMIMFHSEKPAFEWSLEADIPHDIVSI